ncbi:hypothetical protein BSKO_13915 [Bryopsis sp. KO-2023]|nr:hypothetical protein BSKO_13915 [Bryopsis sp. KO-2023]
MPRVRKPPPDARILKIRDNEERLARMERSVKETRTLDAVASWESTTDKKIASNKSNQLFCELRGRRADRLDSRREKLAYKLHVEEQVLQRELVESEETPEERRSKLAARARQLAAAREAERLKLREELADKYFRENCDPLRERLSQKMLFSTIEDRNSQIEEKMARKVLEEEEKRMLAEMYEMERLKKERRFLDDQNRRKAQDDELYRGLSEQMQFLANQKKQQEEEGKKESQKLTKLWENMEEEKRKEALADLEQRKKLAKDVKQFNEMKQEELREAAQKERDLESEYLRQALELEAQAEAKSKELKDKLKTEMVEHRTHLKNQLSREKEDTAEYEANIKNEYDRMCGREDAVRQARENARNRLAHEVHEMQQHQIQEKLAGRHLAAEEAHYEKQRLQEELAQMTLLEEHHKNLARKSALEHRLDLEAQIATKAQRRAAEEHDRIAEIKAAKKAEARYAQKIEEALRTQPPAWHGRKKVEWFH